ncbi:MAG: DUF2391 family protein [Candidatus Nanoarchaeia archaeon]|nr:DUF2391 family protein [Candidatus Nanoarchaeia archaeon]
MKKKKGGNSLSRIESKLNQILNLEKTEVKEEKVLKKEEDEVEVLEKLQLKKIAEEELELKKIEEFEQELKKQVGSHPLTKITIRDVSKGLVGAFFGIVSHYAFVEGADIAKEFTFLRATILLIFSFFLGFTFMYATGFRKIKEKTLVKFFPLRVISIYLISLVSIFIALTLYGEIQLGFGMLDWLLIYKQVASISIPAIMGASAAELIGGE